MFIAQLTAFARTCIGSLAVLGSLTACSGKAETRASGDAAGAPRGNSGAAGRGTTDSGGHEPGSAGAGGVLTTDNGGHEPGSAGVLTTSAGGTAGNGELGGAGSAGTGGLLDRSPAGGPCGQYVVDLASACPAGSASQGICNDAWVTCALLNPVSPWPTTIQSGCGYLFVHQTQHDGDDSTAVYDQLTGQLVFFADVGYTAKGCTTRGMRVGQLPAPCASLENACAESADAGAGGSP